MSSNGGAVLRVDGLRLQRGERVILDGVSLEIARGELVAVMGPSGSGKTTILRAAAGLEAFQSGRIDVDGVALTGGAPIPAPVLRELRRKVGMVFQFHCLFEHLSAIQNVCLAPVHAHHVAPADARARGMELLRAFGVEHRAAALPRQLSGGECQRVAIARALAVDPPVLLMDEPTASLDPGRRGELAATLRELAAEGRTIVVATHDAEFARACAHRVLNMEAGRLATAPP
jgi:ABC-type polar amino acid transport system ATPase subunit